MNDVEVLSLLVAGGAAAAAVARYRRSRPRGLTPGQRCLLVLLCGLCAALVFDAPIVQSAVAAYTDLPYLARLLANVSAMTAVFSASAMVVSTTAGCYGTSGVRQVSWCAGTGVAVIFCMVPLLLCTKAELDPDLTAVIARHDEIAVCQAVYWAYMAGCIFRFGGLMRRYLSRPDIRFLMFKGMMMVTVASGIGIMWLIYTAFIVTVARMGGELPPDSMGVSRYLGACSVSVVVVGLTAPLWTPRFRRLVGWWRAWSISCRLKPLWRMMTELVPDATTLVPEVGWRPDLVLYQRVIQIRDAQLRLMPYVAPDVDELVRRVEHENPYGVERSRFRRPAARLATAIVNYRAGRRSADKALIGFDPTFDDICDEAEWLVSVYDAMTFDPIVASVVDAAVG